MIDDALSILDRNVGSHRSLCLGPLCDEAVAPAWHCLDEARLTWIVAERDPDVADRAFQDRVADEAMAPDGIEQGVLGQEGAGLTSECAQ